MSRRVGLVLALVIFFVAALPRGVLAQAETADALVARGVELRRTGQDQQALELFRRAFEMSHSPRAEAQMGLAEQALGRWLDADLHVREAYAATTDPWIQSHRAGLDASLAVIDQHVGRLEVIGNVPGAAILVNGQPAGTLPLAQPLRLLAGTANIELRASGHQTVQRTVAVVAGRLSRESIDLVPSPAASAADSNAAGAPTTTTTTSPATAASTSSETPASGSARAASPANYTATSQSSGGLSPVVAVIGVAATVISAGVLVWSGLDTLAARDAYVLDPTEAGFNDGVGRQTRTNVLIGTVSVLGVATIAIAMFGTHWGGSPEARATASRRMRQRTLPFLGANGDGISLGLNGTF